MSQAKKRFCPECGETASDSQDVARRTFLQAMSAGVAGAAGLIAMTPNLRAADSAAASKSKPAEALVKELFATLSDDQKKAVVKPWDDGGKQPTRLKTFNAPPAGKALGEQFTKPQQELIKSILLAILSGDDAYQRLTRHGKWDGAGSFEGNGIAIFGDPSGDQPYSYVFAGHHLTLRCDGNSQPNAAFGGPMYYGHSANGHSDQNVYNYQTREVQSVFEMLDEKQRAKAVVVGSAGDGQTAYRLREAGQARPGVHCQELSPAQRDLVAGVMRTLLAPFRKEDGDEVMELLKRNGGLEQIHLAFYKDDAEKPNGRWDSWRLEGPGFVWNYRVLPHVHCFVNIVGQA